MLNFIMPKFFGPGILLAALSIGTSHLIQSTRAGLYFGFELIWLIIIINLIKYPLFRHGMLYAQATGNNLIYGYMRLNIACVWIFFITSILGALAGNTILVYITAGIAQSITEFYIPELSLNSISWTIIILLICITIIISGGYKAVRKIITITTILLLIATLVTFIIAIIKYDPNKNGEISFISTNAFTINNLPFLLALMGWMPGPIDMAVFYSIWHQDKNKSNQINIGKANKIKAEEKDFNIGYIVIVITAIMFVGLGALVLKQYHTNISGNAVVFAHQIISIYTNTIGEWSRIIISICAFAAMFSTALTVLDIVPKTIAISYSIIAKKPNLNIKIAQLIIIILISIVGLTILQNYKNNFIALLDIANIISFVLGPILAILNFKLINSNHIPNNKRPSKLFNQFSILGIVFLIMISGLFLYNKILI